MADVSRETAGATRALKRRAAISLAAQPPMKPGGAPFIPSSLASRRYSFKCAFKNRAIFLIAARVSGASASSGRIWKTCGIPS
jgi:hypothetical protein